MEINLRDCRDFKSCISFRNKGLKFLLQEEMKRKREEEEGEGKETARKRVKVDGGAGRILHPG
jgi:hypothetical protein